MNVNANTFHCPYECSDVFPVQHDPGSHLKGHDDNGRCNIGSVTERLYFFVAEYDERDRQFTGGGKIAEGDDIEVLELPFDSALAMISSGEIRDGKTIMLLQYVALNVFPSHRVRMDISGDHA
jgi:hypothetical protein